MLSGFQSKISPLELRMPVNGFTRSVKKNRDYIVIYCSKLDIDSRRYYRVIEQVDID
jgi:hypothetical protein